MDFGIAGRTALVCGASQGLGRACAEALAAEGVRVTINARRREALDDVAAAIVKAGGPTPTVAPGDVSTEDGRASVLKACPDPDILVTNAGGPPTGDFRNFGRDDWIKALDQNMLAPIALIKATVDAMIRRKFGRIINVTSGAVKAPIPLLALSNGARSGLTGFVSGLAREVAVHNVTINNLMPGNFDTERLQSNFVAMAKKADKPIDDYRAMREGQIPAKRFGRPGEFGAVCAFLCSEQAGYFTAQNVLLDGGAYPGMF
ncbi:MAG TPA: SDR family oxidoreductase [Alphaproteobacteria bacterium]|jgi:3-oxoacyl-[acyl-carrier protein] reductase|nr:SDR family oxidoreductase [Alphaproteobacteria bacterium]